MTLNINTITKAPSTKAKRKRPVIRPAIFCVQVAVTLRDAMKKYLENGLQTQKYHTATNMMLWAKGVTGRTYKRGELQWAYEEVDSIIKENAEYEALFPTAA